MCYGTVAGEQRLTSVINMNGQGKTGPNLDCHLREVIQLCEYMCVCFPAQSGDNVLNPQQLLCLARHIG